MCAGVLSAPLMWWLKLILVLCLLSMSEVYCNSLVDPGFFNGVEGFVFHVMPPPPGPSQSASGVHQHTLTKSPVDINFSFYFHLFHGEGVGLLAVISKHFITVS